MSKNASSKQRDSSKNNDVDDKKFSPTIITNFLNNHYRNAANDPNNKQFLVFKNYTVK